MIKNISKVFGILISKSPKNFILMFFLLGLELLAITLSVLAIIPLADYILDSKLTNPSKFSLYVLNFFETFKIEITFFNLGFLFIVGQLFRGITTSTINYAILRIKYDFVKKINNDALNTILDANWNFFSTSNYGRIINTFTKEISNVAATIGHIAKSFASFVQLIFFISIPIYLNYKVSLSIIFLFAIVVFFIIKFGNPLSFKLGKLNVSTANSLVANFIETLQAAKLIKINSKEKYFKEKHLSKFDNHVSATLKIQMLQQIINAFFQPFGIIVIVSVFGFFLNSGILLSEIAAIFYSLISIVSLLNTLVGTQINISNFLPSYEQVENIILNAKNLKEKFGNTKFNNLNDQITFKDISFSYDDTKNVLENLNFQIKKNKITALVGESGAGKSTIADLIIGIIVPNRGKIVVDKTDIKEFDISSYRNNIGYVSQDIFLFNDTIRNNLKWIVPGNVGDDEILEALRMSNSLEFINDLPKKLDTIVGERGVQLSGGQRQRLSLARTFLKKPKILILDEATSSLDSLSEKEIQNTIEKLRLLDDITFIIIAHRLSTIKNADNILVLHRGKIAQEGDFQKLVSIKDGKFNIMLNSQIIK